MSDKVVSEPFLEMYKIVKFTEIPLENKASLSNKSY